MTVMTPTNAASLIKKYGGIEVQPVSAPDMGLVMGIYGPGGVGKTSTWATITDSELGTPALMINARGNPHVIRSYSDRIDVLNIAGFGDLEKIREGIVKDKQFAHKTVVLDTVSEMWGMDLRDRYGPMTVVDWQKHAATTSDIVNLVRNWSDLATQGPRVNVIFVFQEVPETRDVRGQTGVVRSEIAVSKALQYHIPGLINFLGRLYISSDQPPYRRVLDFRPIETMHQAKLQVDIHDEFARQVPFEVYNPSLASILDTVRGHKPWPVDKHANPAQRRAQ